MAPTSLRHPPLRRQRPAAGEQGAALILELLVGIVVLATAVATAASISVVTNRSTRTGHGLTEMETRIDTDLAQMRQWAELYTWCAGFGTTSSTRVNASPTCKSKSSANSSYYYPDNPPPGNPTAAQALRTFNAACNDGTTTQFNQPLITFLNIVPRPSGVTREVISDDNRAKRLRITYTATVPNSTKGIQRVVVLTPTVAAWCPSSP